MFHTYVLNFKRTPIDIDRAVYLMDKGLWSKVLADKPNEKDPQVWYEDYCDLHREKYGKSFSVDLMETPL